MYSIAIDGPSGAGKSTISKAVANKLDFLYLDTGALYRAIGLFMLRNKINTVDEKSVCDVLPQINIELKYINKIQYVILNDEDVSDDIRQNEVSMAASNVSAHIKVREFLLNLQRDIAKTNNVIMDGRDIGTVILPNAQVKIFLTASPESRAERRVSQLEELGQKADYDTILSEIKERDYNDSNREHCALKQAKDAVLLDSTKNEIYQTVDIAINIIKEKIKI